MESFFKTLKVERIYQTRYETRAQARQWAGAGARLYAAKTTPRAASNWGFMVVSSLGVTDGQVGPEPAAAWQHAAVLMVGC